MTEDKDSQPTGEDAIIADAVRQADEGREIEVEEERPDLDRAVELLVAPLPDNPPDIADVPEAAAEIDDEAGGPEAKAPAKKAPARRK